MSKSLFKEFDSVSAKVWKQKIQSDLKGADYNDTLLWNSIEGINVKPFYHNDDQAEVAHNIQTKATAWNICQPVFVQDVEKANSKAINAIQRGAESIKFRLPTSEVSISALLQNIDLASTAIHFEMDFLSEKVVHSINQQALKHNATIYTQSDIIGNLAKSGNWHINYEEDHRILNTIITQSTALKSCLSIDISLYQNAGATIIQQLAYALAHANEYLNNFGDKVQNKITFNVAVGSNYFFEIAKIRALRLLWKTLATAYFDSPKDCHINAVPSRRNKTLYDYNTNMLRSTTECMSSILGGANSISNLAYDAIYHKDNEFGDRIARNQLLVLKHESYFNKVNNPVDGSYYIETLTQQFAEKSLALFKNIEAGGGFFKQLRSGVIQRKIKESAAIEQLQFDTGKTILLGTNKHPNPNDKMANDLELYPFIKTKQRKTLIEPIIQKRLAETMEQERLKTE